MNKTYTPFQKGALGEDALPCDSRLLWYFSIATCTLKKLENLTNNRKVKNANVKMAVGITLPNLKLLTIIWRGFK